MDLNVIVSIFLGANLNSHRLLRPSLYTRRIICPDWNAEFCERKIGEKIVKAIGGTNILHFHYIKHFSLNAMVLVLCPLWLAGGSVSAAPGYLIQIILLGTI